MLPVSCQTCMQVKKLDMEQQTGSKLGKEYNNAVYCHPAYFTSVQSTAFKMLGWMKHKLESRLPGEIWTTPPSQGYGFSSGNVWMWELDCEESWVLKNWCFWTVVLEKTLESPLDCKEFQPVHSEGDQPWDFFGSSDAKAEAPLLWTPHAKSWLIGKVSDAGRDCGQEEKGTTEDEMAG